MKLLDKVSIYQLIIFFLLSVYFHGLLTFGVEKVLWQALPVILVTTISGLIFDWLELKRWTKPLTPLITGLIIGLVAQFGETPIKLAAIGMAAMAIKFSIKMDGRHIFNPAASGLLFGWLFLSSYPSWWTGAVSFWIFLIWIPILLLKLKRWAPMVGFLLPLALIDGPRILFSSSLLFFTSVMLIEPKTSPAQIKHGLIYGVVVGILYLSLTNISVVGEPLIFSLLLGNLTGRLLQKFLI